MTTRRRGSSSSPRWSLRWCWSTARSATTWRACVTSPRHLRVERVVYRARRHRPRRRPDLAGLPALGAGVQRGRRCCSCTRSCACSSNFGHPYAVPQMSADQAWNTAVSFVTNTNWQSYSGESALGYVVQMAGLAVQNFVSAAVGIAVAIALVRGFARSRTDRLGNFWVDLTRICLRVLLPLSIVFAIVFVARRHDPELPRLPDRAHASPAARRRSPAARSRARRRSRSSARTAAASTTPTPRTRSRTRRRGRTGSRSSCCSASRSRCRARSAVWSATSGRDGRSRS